MAFFAACLAAAAFLALIEDVPLPPGFAEQPGGFAFESLEGRILTAVASGPGSVEAPAAFYQESLPQLGWRRATAGAGAAMGPLVYERGGERLEILLESAAGAVRVRYRLIAGQPSE